MKSTCFFVFLSLFVAFSSAKVFDRCELARALRDWYGVPQHQIATWVCIANYESHFNTDAINHVTGDHGVFQISQIYWCSTSNSPGKACHTTCSKFRDEDLGDDVACIRKIFDEHQRLSGNGFNAWTTYRPYCTYDVERFVRGCF